jgi:hypothetical protein
MLAAGATSGGISASIAGGKFIDGFKQGLLVAGLNHLAHEVAVEICNSNNYFLIPNTLIK